MTNGQVMELHNPVDLPDPVYIDHIEEPSIKATIICRTNIRRHAEALRGTARPADRATYVGNRAMIVYRVPLNEVVFDFYDRLKRFPEAMPASTTRSMATTRAIWCKLDHGQRGGVDALR